jgi:hypothetical protein
MCSISGVLALPGAGGGQQKVGEHEPIPLDDHSRGTPESAPRTWVRQISQRAVRERVGKPRRGHAAAIRSSYTSFGPEASMRCSFPLLQDTRIFT